MEQKAKTSSEYFGKLIILLLLIGIALWSFI